MDPAKLKTRFKWPIHIKIKEVQMVLGFANYYDQFLVNYSDKVCLLINLRKNVPFT